MRESRLFVVGIGGEALSAPEREIFRSHPPGGVILFARNLRRAGQAESLVAKIREAVPDVLIYADQEGGPVDRFRAVVGPSISMRRAAAIGRARDAGAVAGAVCRLFGVDVDLAPVVDRAAAGAGRNVLAERCASDDPVEIARRAGEFLDGLRAEGVAGCLKHFPGLGRGSVDSHRTLPRISESAEETRADLHPFAVLSPRVPLVMVSHAAIGSSALPASLDRRIAQDWLRHRVGFAGAAISDDLEMGALQGFGDLPEAALASVEAGCDLLCLGSRTADLPLAAEKLAAKADPARLARALLRLAELREVVASLRGAALTEHRLDELAARTASLQSQGAELA